MKSRDQQKSKYQLYKSKNVIRYNRFRSVQTHREKPQAASHTHIRRAHHARGSYEERGCGRIAVSFNGETRMFLLSSFHIIVSAVAPSSGHNE